MRVLRWATLVVACSVGLLSSTTPVRAAADPREATARPPATDHIDGAFLVCVFVLEFEAPTDGASGRLVLDGVETVEPHAFEIALSALIDEPLLLADHAAADRFGCLTLVGDGMLTQVSLHTFQEGDPPLQHCGTFSADDGVYILTSSSSGVENRLLTADADSAAILDPYVSGAYAGRIGCIIFDLPWSDDIIGVFGPVACGRVLDANPDPAFAVVDDLEGEVGAVDEVTIDGLTVEGPGSPTSIALLEWSYAVQQGSSPGEEARACTQPGRIFGDVRICGEYRVEAGIGWLDRADGAVPFPRSFLIRGRAMDLALELAPHAVSTCAELSLAEVEMRSIGSIAASVTIDACLVVDRRGRFSTPDGGTRADLRTIGVGEIDPSLPDGERAGVRLLARDGGNWGDVWSASAVDLPGCTGTTGAPATDRPTLTPPPTDLDRTAATRAVDRTALLWLLTVSSLAIVTAISRVRRAR